MNHCKGVTHKKCKKTKCIWVNRKRRYCRTAKNKIRNRVSANKFRNKSLDYAYNNIHDKRNQYLVDKSNFSTDLYQYITIEITKDDTNFIIKITPRKDIYPEYDSISNVVISWNNGNKIASEKKIDKTKVYLVDNTITNIQLYLVMKANNKYPQLLDIEFISNLELN